MRPSRILLVSRDPDFSRIYGLALQHAGHHVLLLDHPDDAVGWAVAERPEIVIVEFPTSTSVGRTVAESLRDDPRTAAIPVVALTARLTHPELTHAHGCGAVRVLTMPISPRDVVREVVEARRLLRASAHAPRS